MTGVRALNVAVVTYNSEDHVGRLLESLPPAAGPLRLSVVVVDNGSRDRTVEAVRSAADVEVIETGANLGYSGGINVARARLGRGDLAILNPDLTLGERSLEYLVESLQDRVGIAVPRLIDDDGQLFTHLRREASVVGTLGDSIFGSHWSNRPRLLSDDLRRNGDYEHAADVAWAGAAAWVVSAECNERVGAWDAERYFLYSEETDYARRARDRGFRVRFDPRATVMHHGGGSGMSEELLALMSVNRIRYFEARNGPTRSTLYRGAVATRHALRAGSRPHRRALATVLARRRWAALPGASRSDVVGNVDSHV